jgi:hypothetical protein
MINATTQILTKGEVFYRNGIALEKGAVISEKRI